MVEAQGISAEEKEACAVSVMRAMLEDYSVATGKPLEEGLVEFAESGCYDMLFDYGTGLWAEGPDYLRSWFDSMRPAD